MAQSESAIRRHQGAVFDGVANAGVVEQVFLENASRIVLGAPETSLEQASPLRNQFIVITVTPDDMNAIIQ